MVTLCTIYILFASLCYYTFRDSIESPIIMDMMPEDNPLIQVVKVLFTCNVMVSYPLTIYITNFILEEFTFKRFKKKSCARTWGKNL